MDISASVPFDTAVRRMSGKTPVASTLRSAAWSDVPLDLRERAQFSSAVNELSTMQGIQDRLMKVVDWKNRQGADESFMSKEKFISEMRKQLGAAEGNSGKMTDITSAERLGLIYDQQIGDAYEYGRWKTGQDPALLAQYPAQELVRRQSRVHPRDWRTRWTGNGGRMFGARMIALKDDPVWTRISRFGKPFPPFDYGSGMGVRDISRDEAIELGVVTRDDPPPKASEAGYNTKLEASVSDLSDDKQQALKAAFGDQIMIDGGKATWRGAQQVLADAYQATVNGTAPAHGKVALGTVRPAALEALRKAGADIDDASSKTVTHDNLQHIFSRHGEGNESISRQRPIGVGEAAYLSWAMDAPDKVAATGGQYEITRNFENIGECHLIVNATKKALSLVTAWIHAGK